MHSLSSSFVLGYHGCDVKVAERLLVGASFVQSQNEYDWLGHGIYFWESNPKRGLDYAIELSARRGSSSKISKATVVGAVLELGFCLDLTTMSGIEEVRIAYGLLEKIYSASGEEMPQNHPDGLRRNLDCAVINLLHDVRRGHGDRSVDTVKGIFTEGKSIYPGSGFMEKTHIQLCVRNSTCIKGVFRVPEDQLL